MGRGSNWDVLYELAAGQQGYFSAAQAGEAGVVPQALHYHAKAENLTRVQRGIYRLSRYPSSENEDMMVVWLWTEQTGVFSHETALQLHRLSDALPAKIHVTLPGSWKQRRVRRPPIAVTYFADIPDDEWEWMANLPVTKPVRTLEDCMSASVSPDLVGQAAEQVIRRGEFNYVPEVVARALGYRYEAVD
jgi:predicted transcriptional regulator of viral defense system